MMVESLLLVYCWYHVRLQLLVVGHGTVYRHISETVTYPTVSSGSH